VTRQDEPDLDDVNLRLALLGIDPLRRSVEVRDPIRVDEYPAVTAALADVLYGPHSTVTWKTPDAAGIVSDVITGGLRKRMAELDEPAGPDCD
jgi:hypothetical protein